MEHVATAVAEEDGVKTLGVVMVLVVDWEGVLAEMVRRDADIDSEFDATEFVRDTDADEELIEAVFLVLVAVSELVHVGEWDPVATNDGERVADPVLEKDRSDEAVMD